jgi:head-tail adaptor
MRVGRTNKWVRLLRNPATENEVEGTPLSPEWCWAGIEPLPPGSSTESRTISHLVLMRFHADVTLDTKIEYADARINRTRTLYVRGVQSVNEAGDEMFLFAEEIQP